MNKEHLQQIFSHYIDQFERINNTSSREYYKWEIAYAFRTLMDAALQASEKDFPAKLHEAKKLSANVIDNYTQPFYGLVKFAGKEPETVRAMLQALLSCSEMGIEEKQRRVSAFFEQSHALRDKYYPDSYLYKDDVHSVTGYLFLYDPDHNNIYKATHAQKFADCIEFYDDWGSGDTVKLDVYERFCDTLVAEIKADNALLSTDASRFDMVKMTGRPMHPDTEKHILAFDLIYCCYTYELFDGIAFTRPKSKERQLILERRNKAKQLFEDLKTKRQLLAEYTTALAYLNNTFIPGASLVHKTFGIGIITNKTDSAITVHFDSVGDKTLGTAVAAANRLICPAQDAEAFSAYIAEHSNDLLNGGSYTRQVESAEKALAPYTEYLE